MGNSLYGGLRAVALVWPAGCSDVACGLQGRRLAGCRVARGLRAAMAWSISVACGLQCVWPEGCCGLRPAGCCVACGLRVAVWHVACGLLCGMWPAGCDVWHMRPAGCCVACELIRLSFGLSI